MLEVKNWLFLREFHLRHHETVHALADIFLTVSAGHKGCDGVGGSDGDSKVVMMMMMMMILNGNRNYLIQLQITMS